MVLSMDGASLISIAIAELVCLNRPDGSVKLLASKVEVCHVQLTCEAVQAVSVLEPSQRHAEESEKSNQRSLGAN